MQGRFTGIRCLVGRNNSDTTTLRTATLDDITYDVYPAIPIVGNVVVRPMGSEGPEFVPAHVLSAIPEQWNGRPVVPDHPTDNDGNPISANSVDVLDNDAFGRIQNTIYDDGRLKTEVWINMAKAEAIGGEPLRVAKSLADGVMEEVSIGCWIGLESTPGEFNGEQYIAQWTSLVSDHLAVGLNGAKGACSVEMGAGAPRAAAQHNSNNNAPPNPPMVMRAAEDNSGGNSGNAGAPIPAKAARYLSFTARRLALNSDIKRSLVDLLWAEVSNFDWYEDHDTESSTVYYTLYSHGLTQARTYNVNSNGIPVSLNDDVVQVVRTTTYEVADVDVDITTATTATAQNQPTKGDGGPDKMSDKKKGLIEKIITNAKSPFGEGDTALLEAKEEKDLETIAAAWGG